VKANLRDERSFAEVVRGVKMNRDASKAVADAPRDRPGRRDGEFRNPQRGDDAVKNFRGGPNQRFNSGRHGVEEGNQFRGGYGRNGGQGGGEHAVRGANPNPRLGGGGYKRGMDDRDGQGSSKDMDLETSCLAGVVSVFWRRINSD
jgi:hypothetical protein